MLNYKDDEDQYSFYAAGDVRSAIAKAKVQGAVAGAIVGTLFGAGAVLAYISTSVHTISYP